MSKTSDNLKFLDPLLLDTLTKDELDLLADELVKESCLSEDHLKEIAGSSGEEQIVLFRNALIERANPGWVQVFVMLLKKLGKQKLARIVEIWLDDSTQHRIAWILESWSDLLTYEKQIKESTFLFTSEKLPEKHWLVEFCYYMGCEETDSETKTKVIEMLQTTLSDSDSFIMLSLPLGFSSEGEGSTSTETENANELDAHNASISETQSALKSEAHNVSTSKKSDNEPLRPEDVKIKVDVILNEPSQVLDDAASTNQKEKLGESTAENVERMLLRLAPLLKCCMNGKTIIKLAKELVVLKYVSTEKLQEFRSRASKMSDEEVFDSFVKFMKENAKEEWKTCLLEAIMEQDLEVLHDVVKKYFEKPDRLEWFLDNWELLQDHRHGLLFAAQSFKINVEMDENKKSWLLSYLKQIVKLEDEIFLQLISKLQQDLSSAANNEQEENSKSDTDSDQILESILPLLKSCMNGKKLIKLAKEFVILNCISSEKFQEFRSISSTTSEDETFTSFVDYVTFPEEAEYDWKKCLLMAIAEQELEVLHDVLSKYFENPAPLDWFVKNWDYLQDKKMVLLSVAKKHNICIEINESEESWLLCCLNEFVKRGDETLSQLTVELQEVELLKVEEDVPNQLTDADEDNLKVQLGVDIDNLLTPLVPLFTYGLSSDEFTDFVKSLVVSKTLSKDLLDQFKRFSESADTYESKVRFFIECLKKCAADSAAWKSAIIDVLKNEDHITLGEIATSHFDNPKLLTWFITNWNNLLMKKDKVFSIARNLHIVLIENDIMWLLVFLNELLKRGEEILQQVTTNFSEKKKASVAGGKIDQHSQDVTDCLRPLIMVLRYCLSVSKLVKVAQRIRDDGSNNLSSDFCNVLEQTSHVNRDALALVELFVTCLKKNATSSWKISFLNALKEEGAEILRSVILTFFDHRNSFLIWVFENWEILENRKREFYDLAVERGLCSESDIDPGGENVVLQVVSMAMMHGDDEQKTLITIFQADEKKKMETFLPAPENQAIIKREHSDADDHSSSTEEDENYVLPPTEPNQPIEERDGEGFEVLEIEKGFDVNEQNEELLHENKRTIVSKIIDVKDKKNVFGQAFTPTSLQKLPNGTTLVEFRARISDFSIDVPEGSKLLLYLVNESDRGFYPMQYFPKLEEYRLSVFLDTSKALSYKYCAGNDLDVTKWEWLIYRDDYPLDGNYNRHWIVNGEQKQMGYAVTFDTIVLQSCSVDNYIQQLGNNCCKFLNCEIDINEQNNNEYAVIFMYYVYRNWFIYLSKGCVTQIVNYNFFSYSPMEVFFGKITKASASLTLLCSLPENVDASARILCALAFLAASRDDLDMKEKLYDGIACQLCLDLSLHELNDEEHELLTTHLKWFHQSFSGKKWRFQKQTLLGTVEKMFQSLSKHPESILMFPILKILQAVSDENVDLSAGPTLLLGNKYAKADWLKNSVQQTFVDLGKKIVRLIDRFPWMREVFSTVITVNTTVKIVREQSPVASIIDSNFAFVKLIDFWNSTVAGKKSATTAFTNDKAMVLISFLVKNIDEDIQSTRKESDEICANQWLRYIQELLNALSLYISKNSKIVNVESVAYMTTLFDYVLIFAQAVEQDLQTFDTNTSLGLQHIIDDCLLKAVTSFFDSNVTDESPIISKKEIEIWSHFLEYKWKAKDIQDEWSFRCEDALKYALRTRLKNTKRFVKFYAYELENMNPCETLEKCVIDELTTKPETNLSEAKSCFDKKNANILKLMWKMFKKKWASRETKCPYAGWLVFIEQWPPGAFLLIQLCEGWKVTSKSLSTKKSNYFIEIFRGSISIIVELDEGAIHVGNLTRLESMPRFWKCYDALIELGRFSATAKYYSVTQYDNLLRLRSEEFIAFKDLKKYLDGFALFVSKMKKDGVDVDCSVLEKSLEVANFSEYELRKLVVCKPWRQGKSSDEHSELFFPLDRNELVQIKFIMGNNCLRNKYVKKIVFDTALTCSERLNINSFLENVWQPALEVILHTSKRLIDGSIKFLEVDQLLQNEADDHVLAQVKIMCSISGDDSDKIEIRAEQIRHYLMIKRKQKTAQLLIDLRQSLGLKGKFGAFKESLDENRCLSSIDRKTKKALSILEDVSEQQFQHLECFCQGKDLLQWVKANMNDLTEVTAMSDLAMISAGENPMDLYRVSCFLSAVKGFSPLIFDLPESSGLLKLIEACRQVWKNIARDKTIVPKWEATNKQMEWLKSAMELRGSIEKSSITRTQLINSSGVYFIGRETEKIPTVKNCLKLQIPKSEKNKEIEMNLDELHDLQSRLMLIAGEADKGKDEVTRFIDVLANVENLAKAYVQLKVSGCPLFNNWTASIRCKKQSKTRHWSIEISFDSSASKVTTSNEILLEVKELTDVLQQAYERWKDYLFKKRNKHYYLNHFNIRQLTYLCKKLSCEEGNQYPDQVYQLLAGVAGNVSQNNIISCLEEVVMIDDEPEQDDLLVDPGNDGEKIESVLDKKKRVIRQLVTENGFPEGVAKAAVQIVSSLDEDDCYFWAMQNANNRALIAEYQKKFDDELVFSASGNDINAIQDVINDRVNLTLEQLIELILSALEKDDNQKVAVPVKTVCERYFQDTAVTSLNDCISLEHLGQFLSKLTQIPDGDLEISNRKMPEQFFVGKPNLVVGKKLDVWTTILSIYISLSNQRLPSAAEVLVCNESTNSEEVELLLRRALQNSDKKGKQIFCLSCADLIDINVAINAEKMYSLLSQLPDRDENFQLVVLVTSLQHHISALFEEYRVNAVFTASEAYIKRYINKNLSTDDFQCDIAPTIDYDRSLVRVICSEKSGMGKSLFTKRLREKLPANFKCNSSIIRLLEKEVDVDDAIETLTRSNKEEIVNAEPHFIHIDITPAVYKGVRKFLFDLIILGELKSSNGMIWKRRSRHFYALEYTYPTAQGRISFSNLLDLLPRVNCVSPVQVIKHMEKNLRSSNEPKDQVLMDEKLLNHEVYQRPFQYLFRFAQGQNLDSFSYEKPNLDALICLHTLLKYCGIKDPSWSELSNFAKFLNTQLYDCENSCYLNVETILDGVDPREVQNYKLHGFKLFVVRFMIRMSQDFATSSLNTGENTVNDENNVKDLFELHQLRRRWENDFHPYLFFNYDRISFSFVHFSINDYGDLCSHKETDNVVEENIMPRQLVRNLKSVYKAKVQQDFDKLSRKEKLETLCHVFGVNEVFDPDLSYELTTDNVLKMLAIHMRFRCGIPVVIMGETGCGKTRMIDFMSKLKAGGNEHIENMVVVKVHGGISVSMIQEIVKGAVELARKNAEIETILFFDEANTTEAIYAIKEIVCDATVHGEPFAETGLKIVAACNPYRKHEEKVIEKMMQSGLGFHVKTEDVNETFGSIPMRHLVYRVIPLPPSMQPLVWDFGQLNNNTEKIYIERMVVKMQENIIKEEDGQYLDPNTVETLTQCLSASQQYMREKRDLCSFVSLRDVERSIATFKWFRKQLVTLSPLITKEKNKVKRPKVNFTPDIQAIIHALGVCYHVTLDDRKSYRDIIAAELHKTEADILNEIVACQNVFINAIELDKDIGRNEALTENVFMMVICAELRIPLFLIGKPGSSKSLAKTIVTDAMQGNNSKSDLFKQLKQIYVSSFQCSPITDAIGIQRVFNQCAQLQEDHSKLKDEEKPRKDEHKREKEMHENRPKEYHQEKDQAPDDFVAVVVLDEIGLAEDSPKMPLKVLHPLLENATTNVQLSKQPHSKVGFVGISNWALDPAKMNRGIFVTRGQPSQNDLEKTALAIFESDDASIDQDSHSVIKALTAAYLKVCEYQAKEFFGLRDYYALLKMLFVLVSRKAGSEKLSFDEIAKLVLRNFSGFEIDYYDFFKDCLVSSFKDTANAIVKVPVMDLIQENLTSSFESRFLLLITNQYSAVSLLPQVMLLPEEVGSSEVVCAVQDYQVIFGSSFPRDNDYTEVCRNINRIKVCMETGRTVVLLNLKDLYESLYDALNQHYVTVADQRFVDLGLGGHRVKCRMAKKFRLIVIEEKKIVYDHFPIPLINRLEKHMFDMNSILNDDQIEVATNLRDWIKRFTSFKQSLTLPKFTEKDTFLGYTDDTPASALMSSKSNSFDLLQKSLLQTASLDGVCRLPNSELYPQDVKNLICIYMKEQEHDNLLNMLQTELKSSDETLHVFEVTSFSQTLQDKDRLTYTEALNLKENSIMLLTLQQFPTERSFSEQLNNFFKSVVSSPTSPYILLIQCSQSQLHGDLIACAKYSTMNKVKEFKSKSIHYKKVLVLFLFTMERNMNVQNEKFSFSSFHSQNCSSLYIDELKPSKKPIADISCLWDKSVPDVIEKALNSMELEKPILDFRHLVQDCVAEAVAKLEKDGVRQESQITACDDPKDVSTPRNRAKIIEELCFVKFCSKYFLSILGKHILQLLRDKEKNAAPENEAWTWIVDVACSPQDLQEGGSFKNSVWLHLRKLTSTAIAKTVSVIDVDNNLDLIEHPELTDLWLEIFNCTDFFGNRWPDSRLASNFVVKSEFRCSFPFFRLFVQNLWKQWVIVKARNVEDKHHVFLTAIVNSNNHTMALLESVPRKKKFMEMFVHDLVSYFFRFSTNNKVAVLQTVQRCVLNLFQAVKQNVEVKGNVFVEIFLLYQGIQNELELFASTISVLPDILESESRHDWERQQSQHDNFVVHVLAFQCLIAKLDEKTPKKSDDRKTPDALKTLEQWKSLINMTKPIADRLVQECTEDIQLLWTRIVFLEMFLEQLVPPATTTNIAQKYLATIAPHARRLSNARFVDFSDMKFLNILCKSLEGCLQEVNTQILCNWQSINCKSCRNKIINPVLLFCGKHYVCQGCVPSDKKCVPCSIAFPENHKIVPVAISDKQAVELRRFKLACTSLFLEYLSTFCFPLSCDAPPDQLSQNEEKMKIVFERLVVCESSLEADPSLPSNFGFDIADRSYMLQLLNNYDPASSQLLLSKYMKDTGINAEVYDICANLYRYGLESEIRSNYGDEEQSMIASALDLLYECTNADTKTFNHLQHIDYCVKMQWVVLAVVTSLHHSLSKKSYNQKQKEFVMQVRKICKDDKFHMIQKAVVKELCQKYGMDMVKDLAECEQLKSFIPLYLLPDQIEQEINLYLESDMLVLCGDSYRKTKDTLQNITKQSDFAQVFEVLVEDIEASADSTFQIFLALSAWAGKGAVSNKLRRNAFHHITEQLEPYFSEKKFRTVCDCIAENNFFRIKRAGLSDQMHHKLTELLTVFRTTATWCRDGLLADFNRLIRKPCHFAKAFLPTMQQSGYFKVKEIIAQDIGDYNLPPKPFLCPNGHLYFIGECTKANQSAFCPECLQPIGGQDYNKLHQGNQAGDISEDSQAGYKLRSVENQLPVTPERSLSGPSVCVIRFCLHAAMLLSTQSGNDVEKIIGNKKPASSFLLAHLINDLNNLSKFLDINVDDSFLIMHEIFKTIRQVKVEVDREACNFKSMAAREKWEEEFQRHYLNVVFSNADRIIRESQFVLLKAARTTRKPLETLVYELDVTDKLPNGALKWDWPYLWKSRKYVSIDHVKQKLQAVEAGGEGSILKAILDMDDLHLIQYLDDVLDLQSFFMERYGQTIDLHDADLITLREHLGEESPAAEQSVDLYIGIWNMARHALSKDSRYKSMSEHFKLDMNHDSRISMFLPSKRGQGRCAYVLVEYLIDRQNEILQLCRENIKPKPSFAQIDAAKLTKKDLICIDSKHDLMTLLLTNHHYDTVTDEAGFKQKITYDFGLLEKKIVEKYIARKAEVKYETVPFMLYPQDFGIAKDYEAVSANTDIKQIPLPVRMCHDIDISAENTMTASVCEAVRTIIIIIQFLAKSDCDARAEKSIRDYAEKDLLIPPEEAVMIPRSTQICHCLALYERFSWHRSKKLIQNGQKPFEVVLECAEDIKSEKVIDNLTEKLKEMNIERLQLEMNAMLMVGPKMQLDWRLGNDVLYYYVAGKYDVEPDNLSWCESLPEEVLYKHAAHVFELSVHLTKK